jgi:hypothetical protein
LRGWRKIGQEPTARKVSESLQKFLEALLMGSRIGRASLFPQRIFIWAMRRRFVESEEKREFPRVLVGTERERNVRMETNEKSTCLAEGDSRRVLPISNALNLSVSVDEKEIFINNERVGIVLDRFCDVTSFVQLPPLIPESVRYFKDSLCIGVSRGRELVSFTVGKSGEPFSLGNYTICGSLPELPSIVPTPEGVFVKHSGGVSFLRPVES